MPSSKSYGTTRSGVVITEEVAERLAAEAQEGYENLRVVRRRGRPARESQPELERRLAEVGAEVARLLEAREDLIVEAVEREVPRRRIAEAVGVGVGTVNRIAEQHRGTGKKRVTG